MLRVEIGNALVQQRTTALGEQGVGEHQPIICLARLPEGAGLTGVPRQCRAHTRKGTPCQREPLPGRDYCPSHKHLEETFEAAEVVFEDLEAEPYRELTAA